MTPTVNCLQVKNLTLTSVIAEVVAGAWIVIGADDTVVGICWLVVMMYEVKQEVVTGVLRVKAIGKR